MRPPNRAQPVPERRRLVLGPCVAALRSRTGRSAVAGPALSSCRTGSCRRRLKIPSRTSCTWLAPSRFRLRWSWSERFVRWCGCADAVLRFGFALGLHFCGLGLLVAPPRCELRCPSDDRQSVAGPPSLALEVFEKRSPRLLWYPDHGARAQDIVQRRPRAVTRRKRWGRRRSPLFSLYLSTWRWRWRWRAIIRASVRYWGRQWGRHRVAIVSLCSPPFLRPSSAGIGLAGLVRVPLCADGLQTRMAEQSVGAWRELGEDIAKRWRPHKACHARKPGLVIGEPTLGPLMAEQANVGPDLLG